MNLRYNSYSSFFKNKFGTRLQKLSIDAGFSCPNRSSDRSQGGCIFCNNKAFNPSYCSPTKSITQQLEEGIEFHRRRYRNSTGYLAYFQPYSNTYADIDTLRSRYEEALRHPLVKGIIIGTRPDCIDEDKISYIASLSKDHFVAVEYGIESCYDSTLDYIRRGHKFESTRQAIELTARYGIHCGGHLILGLPGESREMMLDEMAIINSLPLNTLKFHQLQIIKGTPLEKTFTFPHSQTNTLTHSPTNTLTHSPTNEFPHSQTNTLTHSLINTFPNYISLVCDLLERLRPDIMIERLAGEVPPRFQAFPELSWRRPDGRLIRNEEIGPLVNAELERRNSCQGKLRIEN